MAVTENSYTGNGSTTNYSFTFPYLKSTDVQVQVDATVTTAWTFANATTVQFNTAPSNGAKIKILRDTNVDSLAATFYAGSAIKSEDLNDNYTQNLYKTQEVGNRYFSTTGGTMTGDLTLGEDVTLTFEGATDDAHETKLTVADPTADRTITLPNVTGTVITTGDTGTVAHAMLAGDAVDGDNIANDSINSEHYVDGSIDTAHIADSQVTTAKIANSNVTTAKIADSNVTTAKIANDAINGTKIADDSINSEHYVDASIDTAHIADSQITTAKIANDAVTADKIANTSVTAGSYSAADITVDAQGRVTAASSGAIATSEITDSAITTAKLGADSVTGAKIADNAVDSEHYTDGSIDTAHIGDSQVTTAKIAADNITSALIADDQINSEHYVDGSIDTAHIASAQVTDAKLATNSVTTGKITDSNVTTAKIADSNVTLAKLASDLKQTTISDSDTQIPTSGAVVDYVAAQIGPIGGLEVIATEVAFPNTQPASGVVISISDAGGVVFNGSGVSTTGRTVGGSTVTINGAPSSLYSETLVAGVGLMVSSTGSSQTYNYHKILGKEDDIKQLSDDINDFNSRYRVASSAPTSSKDDGDLWFDTTNGKMMVYNATNTAWEEVSAIGSFNINTISSSSSTGGGSATLNGTAYRFTLSNPPQDAQQLLVSINGVIQKPNAGSSQPSEGFVVSGNDIIFSNPPASGSDYFIVTLGQSVQIGTPSDGTVSTAKLANGAVTTAKIADSAVTSAKIADGAIVNADVNASAAIAGTKISPDFGSQNVVTTGTLGSGNLTITGTQPSLAFTDSNNDPDFLVYNNNGILKVYDSTNNADRIQIQADGTVDVLQNLDAHNGLDVTGNITVTGTVDGVDIAALNTTVGNITTDVVSDTSPQLGGDLDTNSHEILLDDNHAVKFGAASGGDLKILHDGTNSEISNYTGTFYLFADSLFLGSRAAGEPYFKGFSNGAAELYYNSSKKFSTINAGAYVTGSLGIGAVTNPSHHYNQGIHVHAAGTGAVLHLTDNTSGSGAGDGFDILSHDGAAYLWQRENANMVFGTNGQSRWNIYGSNGHLVPNANNTYDIGDTSNRVRNIYTNDLNLSNEGSSNDVDGTWGDWTIQEGESDLFLKNNRSGKKFKFNLTEVS